MKAQCEIRGLEKQLLLAHMRADLETEESFSSSTTVIYVSHCAEAMPNCGGGEEAEERDFRAENQDIDHHQGGPFLQN